jgi:hypothetical protein
VGAAVAAVVVVEDGTLKARSALALKGVCSGDVTAPDGVLLLLLLLLLLMLLLLLGTPDRYLSMAGRSSSGSPSSSTSATAQPSEKTSMAAVNCGC